MRLKGLLLGVAVATLAMIGIARESEAQVCPSGWRWSRFQSRCIKRCPPNMYFSHVDGQCRLRGRHYKKCGPGYFWSYSRRMCLQHQQCGPGRFFDYTAGRCRRQRTACAPGSQWSPYQRRCISRCPTNWVWNGSTCVAPQPVVQCGPGSRWDPTYRRCVAVNVQRCPPGTSWNGYRCRPWRQCPPNHYWSTMSKSCRPRVKNCPQGYNYRPGWGCQRICPPGHYYQNGRCLKPARSCPPSMFYNAHFNRCVKRCGPGTYWSYSKHRCKRRRW